MRLLTRLAREKIPSGPGGASGEASGGSGPGREAHEPEASEPGTTGGEAGRGAGGHLEGLTPRELEVLRLLSRGQTNPQIAQNLLYSVSTVKAYVRSILFKLGVSDRTQAAVRAIEAGMVTSDVD